MMTEARGASNEKAKRELGWQPHHASWRDGFTTGLDAEPPDVAAARAPSTAESARALGEEVVGWGVDSEHGSRS